MIRSIFFMLIYFLFAPCGFANSSTNKIENYAKWQESYRKAYPRGDVYYLIGNLSVENAYAELKNFTSVARWLSNRNYRTIINANAGLKDVREAVSNPNTVAIIWSSHGSKDGYVYSAKGALPKDTFVAEKSDSLKLIIFSSCYGSEAAKNYEINYEAIYWDGITDSKALKDYLFSSNFDTAILRASDRAQETLSCNLSDLNKVKDIYAKFQEIKLSVAP